MKLDEKKFINACNEYMRELGDLKILPGMEPDEAENVVKDANLSALFPESMNASLCTSMNGRVVVEAAGRYFHDERQVKAHKHVKEYEIGRLEYYDDSSDFTMWLDATDETKKTADAIVGLNKTLYKNAQRDYDFRMQYATKNISRIDAFAINGGSEKIYAIIPSCDFPYGWLETPVLISLDVRNVQASKQNCEIGFVYPYMKENLQLKYSFSMSNLPVEDAYSRIRAMDCEQNFYPHSIKIADGEDWNRLYYIDGFLTTKEQVDPYNDPLDEADGSYLQLVEGMVGELALLSSEDKVRDQITAWSEQPKEELA